MQASSSNFIATANAGATAFAQPFIKLFQSNLALFMPYMAGGGGSRAVTPPVPSWFSLGASPTQGDAPSSAAFVELSRGLVKNHTEFMTELGRAGMDLMAQGQGALARPAVKDSVTQPSAE